jgi:hypothetical protein
MSSSYYISFPNPRHGPCIPRRLIFPHDTQQVSHKEKRTRGVSHYGIAFYIKKNILRQKKKNYGNSNISPCENIIFQESSKRDKNLSRYYYNSIITNLKFQHKPKYHLSKILI